jgi:hypothetical protein
MRVTRRPTAWSKGTRVSEAEIGTALAAPTLQLGADLVAPLIPFRVTRHRGSTAATAHADAASPSSPRTCTKRLGSTGRADVRCSWYRGNGSGVERRRLRHDGTPPDLYEAPS